MGNNLKGRIAFAQAVGDTEEVTRLLALQDREREQKAAWAKRNPDSHKEWYRKNREKHVAKVNQNMRDKKLKLIELFGNKCHKCQRSYHPACYDFHHLDPETKEFGIGMSMFKSFEALKKEAEKCVMVCANCHREIHACSEEESERTP